MDDTGNPQSNGQTMIQNVQNSLLEKDDVEGR